MKRLFLSLITFLLLSVPAFAVDSIFIKLNSCEDTQAGTFCKDYFFTEDEWTNRDEQQIQALKDTKKDLFVQRQTLLLDKDKKLGELASLDDQITLLNEKIND